MLKISITEAKKGMVLGEDIVTSSGNVLLLAGCILTDSSIKRIQRMDIDEIEIIEEKEEVEVTGCVETESGELKKFDSENIEIIEDEEIQKEVENDFNEMAETAKSGILNLNLPTKEIMKNTEEVTNMMKNGLQKNTKEVFNSILKVREIDEYLFRHSVNVTTISFLIGKWMKYDELKMGKLMKAALLHDIGKLKVPGEILNKPGRLTEEEFKIMKSHAVHTYKILQTFEGLDSNVMTGATMHHEKMDGSGYPLGVKGERIHEFAKIIAIADIFDAMTSERVYKKKVSPFKVIEMFESNSFGELDLNLTRLFVHKFIEYYIGSKVKLNDGKVAKIVKINLHEITKPLIMTDAGEVIDMSIHRNVQIEDILAEQA